MKFLSLNFS